MSTFTTNKNLEQPAHGSFVDDWDQPVNSDLGFIDTAFGGSFTLNANGLSGTQVLTVSQYLPLGLIITGTPAGPLTYQVPAGIGGLWIARNRASGSSITIGFNSASGGSTVNIPQNTNVPITADGSALGMVPILTATGAAAGSNTQIQFNSLGNLAASSLLTWDGTTFRATGLNVAGNAVLGVNAGSTITINGTAVSAPNGLNFNGGQLQFGSTGGLGIGIAPTGAALAVGGSIQSTSGGVTFPDATVQVTSATSYFPVSAYVTVNISTGAVTIAKSTGITSIVRNSAGLYTVTMSTGMPDVNYKVLVLAAADAATTSLNRYAGENLSVPRTTTIFHLYFNGDNIGNQDPLAFSLEVFA